MNKQEMADIYQRRSHNRRQMALAVFAYTSIVMLVSGFCLYLLYRVVNLNFNFWFLLSVFWLVFLIYVILRYALGGKLALRSLITIPSWETDRRLENALMAAKLASGMASRIRLLEIPDSDINAFSISLPDGSYALFAALGIADKLPEREREAVMAHEIAHMQAGDTLIHTVMIHLAGRRALKKMVKGLDGGGSSPLIMAGVLAVINALAWIAVIAIVFFTNENKTLLTPQFSQAGFWSAIAFLFFALAMSFPLFMSKLLQLVLDKEREHFADMEAVYLTRDPGAVYRALKHTADDVIDVLLLPACYDALLFNPVVNYTSYTPFRTQPTMGDRMKRIKNVFPQVDI
jgi:Zn-dependent protease with chaperone function